VYVTCIELLDSHTGAAAVDTWIVDSCDAPATGSMMSAAPAAKRSVT
jgi:hypothetical protein